MTKDFTDLYDQHVAQKRAEAEAKAHEYLTSKKERKDYYEFSVSPIDDESDSRVVVCYPYSKEDFAQIINLFINVYNKEFAAENPVSSFDEIRQDIELREIEGYDAELDKFFEKLRDDNFILYDINPTPCHLYAMSAICWYPSAQQLSERKSFSVELSDEEYIYLLTEQLCDRATYTFNRLVFERPELAQKISYEADASNFYGIANTGHPFLVILDEVISDAEVIDGPVPQGETLYEKNDNYDDETEDVEMFHVIANTDSRKLYFTEEDWKPNENFASQRFLNDIDADEVMHLLGADSYSAMLQTLKQKFHERTALDDIRTWLIANNITFSEGESE